MFTDLIFCSHNRLRFTQETFTALMSNTAWAKIATLYVFDDQSRDGSNEWLAESCRDLPVATRYRSAKFGGPVSIMNAYLDEASPRSEAFVKVDNDFLVCPGWLDVLTGVMESQARLDVLGLEAGFGGGLGQVDGEFSYRLARHVGGIGLFRTRMFRKRRPRGHGAGGRFGWTGFQTAHSGLIAWLTPDIPCFALDRLPFEPWVSLTEHYVERGWQRQWPGQPGGLLPKYPDEMRPYYEWWKAKVGS